VGQVSGTRDLGIEGGLILLAAEFGDRPAIASSRHRFSVRKSSELMGASSSTARSVIA
jgi:hypothetical protein